MIVNRLPSTHNDTRRLWTSMDTQLYTTQSFLEISKRFLCACPANLRSGSTQPLIMLQVTHSPHCTSPASWASTGSPMRLWTMLSGWCDSTHVHERLEGCWQLLQKEIPAEGVCCSDTMRDLFCECPCHTDRDKAQNVAGCAMHCTVGELR